MNRYRIPYDQETLSALALLATGVTSICVKKDFPHSESCHSCWLETSGKKWILLQAAEAHLEFKFEVFQLQARSSREPDGGERHPFTLTGQTQVIPLVCDSWLDPAIPVTGAIGSEPVMQFVGRPNSAPSTATATCHYLGGVELIDSNDRSIVIATASFPYLLHVSGFHEDRFFDREAYVGLRAATSAGS